MSTFTLSETKWGLFAVKSDSATPKAEGGELVMRLLTNNADSQKALSAANDLLAELEGIPATKRLDVTVCKPLANESAVSPVDEAEADTILRYTVTVKQLERRARAIVELFASDLQPIVVKEGKSSSRRKQGRGLAAGLRK